MPAHEDSQASDGAGAVEQPGFGSRGRARRRARFLRKARELAYRDLGGLVYNLHRFGQRNDELVLAKLSTLGQIDGQLRALESALAEREPVTVLREAGITACPRCAAIHSSEDRFCPNCGLSMARHVDLPIAGAAVTGAAAAAGAPSASPPQAQAPAAPHPPVAPAEASATGAAQPPAGEPAPSPPPAAAPAPAPSPAPAPAPAPARSADGTAPPAADTDRENAQAPVPAQPREPSTGVGAGASSALPTSSPAGRSPTPPSTPTPGTISPGGEEATEILRPRAPGL